MGLRLHRNINPNEEFLSIARAHARDADVLCLDVAAAIFPAALHPASEATISAASVKLYQIMGDVERSLVGTTASDETWSLLARSGFLREPDLVDFVLARVAEDKLDARFDIRPPPLVTALLDHHHTHVKHAAAVLLAADSLHRHSGSQRFLAMPPELLHKTIWRVVAALEVWQGNRSAAVIDAARSLIAGYNEASTAQVAARKIVHFVGDEMRLRLLDPVDSGVHLFAAQLGYATRLDHDHVLRIIDLESALPSIVLLAGAALPKSSALSLLFQARTHNMTSREAYFFDQNYDKLGSVDATREIATWAASRSHLLNFGPP